MNKLCEEFQKIEEEFNEKIEEFQRIYDETKVTGNVNLEDSKNFFEELEKFKREIREKKEKLTAKISKDINTETRVYMGGFEDEHEKIFENLKNPLFINRDVVFSASGEITKIPKNLVFNNFAFFEICRSLTEISQNVVFNDFAYFEDCTSLTKISQDTVFNKDAYFKGCTALSEKTIEQLKQMKKTGKIKGTLTLPNGDEIV